MPAWRLRIGGTRGRFPLLKATLAAIALGGLGFVSVLGSNLIQFRRDVPASESPQFLMPVKGTGSLVIVGGGKIPDHVRRQFVELAGGKNARIVLIPTAHLRNEEGDTASDLAAWESVGLDRITIFHTKSRERANSPEFVKTLREATGVWIGGGNQSWVMNVYADTLVERELHNLLDRGGVIGGSSAGAAVMTRVMIESGRTEARVARGFDFLPNAVIDQHFLRRNRTMRLLNVLKAHPKLVGFGIDESTAMVIRGHRLNIIGDSYVLACLPPSSEGGLLRLEVLKKGDEVDLDSLRGDKPIIAANLDWNEIQDY